MDLFVVHERQGRMQPHPETSHTEHGLTLLTSGWFRMEHGGPIKAEAGSITVVPAGVPHAPLEGQDIEYWMVGFCAACLKLDEQQPLMQPFRRVRQGALPVVPLSKAAQTRALQLLQELHEEQARRAPESPALMRSLLQLLLGCVLRAMPAGVTRPSAQGALVSEALTFIQRRCLEPISLRDVAEAVHRTPAHVAATIKQKTGYSVGAWITAGRVAEAAARLSHTEESIDEIAERVGWGDKTHFIRQFKKAYGVTPAAFRRGRTHK